MHVILGISMIVAPTAEEADYLASSSDLGWSVFIGGVSAAWRRPLRYSPQERVVVEMNRARHCGTPDKVANLIRNIASDLQVDEDDHVDGLRTDGALPRLRADCKGTRRIVSSFCLFDSLWPFGH